MDTMTLVNDLCDRYGIGVSPEVESLGRKASECELWAAQTVTPKWEKNILLLKAEKYRAAQMDLLAGTSPAEARAWFEDRELDERLRSGETVRLRQRRTVPDPMGELSQRSRSTGTRLMNAAKFVLCLAVYVGFVAGFVLLAHRVITGK